MTLDWGGFAFLLVLIYGAYRYGRLEQEMSDDERDERRTRNRLAMRYNNKHNTKQGEQP